MVEAFYKFQYPTTKAFLDFLDVQLDMLSFDKIIVFSEAIPKDSLIRKNIISYYFENKCIITLITQDKI